MKSHIEEQARVWERMFFQNPPDHSIVERDWSWLTEKLQREGVEKVLDLGCGRGHWSIALARAGFQVTAVDISKTAIEHVLSWAIEENLAIEAFICPAQEIPTDRVFDAAIANSVLDHMFKEEAEEAMRRIYAVLRPGGLLFLGLDGPPDEEDENWPHTVLPDGTWQFHGGRRDRMLWRFWTDEETRTLLLDLAVEEFLVFPNGKRKI